MINQSVLGKLDSALELLQDAQDSLDESALTAIIDSLDQFYRLMDSIERSSIDQGEA